MATTTETRVVYGAGLVQGIVLVAFPAASTIFTDPDEYDLSRSQYGALFLPQVVTAIAASVLGTRLAEHYGAKRVYLAGLTASLLSMALLVASTAFTDDTGLAYGMLLVATGLLGLGLGLTVPALNTLTAAFHPDAVDRSILTLNALLGLGTVLAPVFVAVFDGLGFWWGLPLLSSLLLVGLLLVSAPLSLRTGLHAVARPEEQGPPAGIPRRFWLYAGFAVLYGIYRLLPFVLAVALVAIASLGDGDVAAGVLAFGLAGLGCSALLPLTISFAEEKLVTISAAAAGWVIAAYQLGYGIAAFGAGPLQDAGVTLPTIFALAAVAAVAMGLLATVIARPGVQSRSRVAA
jgi:MFS family permease